MHIQTPTKAMVEVADENALDVLSRQHREVRDLFEQVRDPNVDREAVWKELIEHVTAHVAVERSFVYPVIRGQKGLDQLRHGLEHDYKQMGHLLVVIYRRPINGWDMPMLLTQLLDVFKDHQERCGQVLIPTLRERLTETQLDEFGAKMAEAEKVILADFHPHLIGLGPVYRWTTRIAPTWKGKFGLARPRPWIRSG